MPCMLKDRQGQAVEPTKSARSGSGLPAVSRLGCRLDWSERLRLVVGHARTVRPDPSTLDAVGERGSHREGRLAACFRLVHQIKSALRVYGLPTGSCDVAQRVNRPLGLPCLLYLVVSASLWRSSAGGEHRVGRISDVQACSERGSFST